MKTSIYCAACLFVVFLCSGCGTVGKEFDESQVNKIATGTTTKNGIRKMFGEPFRTGRENGREVWIYEYNKYYAIGTDTSKDLIVVFDDDGKVHSHQIMSSSPP